MSQRASLLRTSAAAGAAAAVIATSAGCGGGAVGGGSELSGSELEDYAMEADSGIDGLDCDESLEREDGETISCLAEVDDGEATLAVQVEFRAGEDGEADELRFSGGVGSSTVDIED